MIFKIGELKQIEESLGKLLRAELPIKVSYRMGKTAKSVRKELEDFEEARMSLFRKYGNETENQQIHVPEENMPEFMKDMESLLSEEVDIVVNPISVELLDDSIKLSSLDIANLDAFLTE